MKKINFIALAVLLISAATISNAQTSNFTYQGRLTLEGGPANGAYDMQFKLFDSDENQIGSTFTNPGVNVTNGIFAVQLDFGAAAFSGAERYLEISVRPAGSADSYDTLLPRQLLTSAVYAIRAVSATTADNANQLAGVAASQYIKTGDARLTDARPPTAGSTNYIQNSNAVQANSNFNLSGNGTVGGSLSGNTVNATTQYNFVGQRFLRVANNGSTLLGLGAGAGNITTQDATFVGKNAGFSNTSGSGNTFVGAAAGSANTVGAHNSFFGTDAGQTSVGDGNSMFGSGAGQANTTGHDNAFFGTLAGANNNGAIRNSLFGAASGDFNHGSYNSFFGYEAGLSNIADGNSFFGDNSGRANTSGSFNSFFGRVSGGSNTDGSQNSFFGASAGSANTSGDGNSFFGANAGAKTEVGAQNSFFGSQAGYENKNGVNNSFFGWGSGQSNLSGNRNSFFGYAAGHASLSASDSAYFGYEAGVAATGSSNAMFGGSAGNATTTGFANSFFGKEAGLANQNGFENVFVGRQAGSGNISGNNNTIVGTNANVGSSGLGFATAIGAQATVATSNTIVLGRSNGSDGVQVPGTLTLNILGVIGSTSLCRNALNQISLCSSSLRYKKDLQPFNRGLSLLNQLKPITFKWKADNSDDLGFGAEDIAAVEPLLVTRNAKGEVEGVKYDRITAVLVNAVNEQQQQIKQQQGQIESLKALVCRRNRRARVCR